MSYIFNNKVSYADTFDLDAFGRLRTSGLYSLIEIRSLYDKLPQMVDEVVNGTATSTVNTDIAAVVMGTTSSGDYVIRQTKQRAIYQPGKSQICEFSFSDFQLQTDNIKRVGYFTSTTAATYNSNFDGFFLESNGVNNSISFQIWRTGTLVLSADSSTWDTSEVDISSVDWSKTQLAVVDFQWLGVGRLRFGLSLSGKTVGFVEHTGSNNLSDVYMSSPNQPIRYEIRNSGSTSAQFHQICSQISSEGTQLSLNRKAGISSVSATTFASDYVKYPYLGIRAGSNYSDIALEIDNISILNTSNDNYLVTVEINPTISVTPNFQTGNTSDYEFAVGSGSTQTVTTDGYILASFLGTAGTSATSFFNFGDCEIRPGRNINGTRDQLWICITPFGANAAFHGSLNFQYQK